MNEIPVSTVNEALDGDRDAVSRIIEALEGPIFNVAYRMMLNQEDAKDATQEALIRIITRMSTYNAEAKFTTWAWRVAMNRILDYKDTLYRQARVDVKQFVEDLGRGLEMDQSETPENALALTQLKIGCASALLHSLDGAHRAAFILVEIMNFSSFKSAQILEINEAALRKRVSRARSKVREALEHCGIVNPDTACRCYRRYSDANRRGRVPALPVLETMELDELSRIVQQVDRLAQTAVFYRAEPALQCDLKAELLKIVEVKKPVAPIESKSVHSV